MVCALLEEFQHANQKQKVQLYEDHIKYQNLHVKQHIVMLLQRKFYVMKESMVLQAIHKKAFAVFKNSGQCLKETIETFQNGYHYYQQSVELMQPIHPMCYTSLKNHTNIMGNVVENNNYMVDIPCVAIEVKQESTRVHIHKKNGQVIVYKSSLKQLENKKYSNIINKLNKATQLTPDKCAGVEEFQVTTVDPDLIVDGELINVDIRNNTVYSSKIPIKKNNPNFVQKFIITDIISYNGFTLIDRPLYERKSILQRMLTETDDIIISKYLYCADQDQINNIFQSIKDREYDKLIFMHYPFNFKLESVVFKCMYSVYNPGKSLKKWWKIKRSVIENNTHNNVMSMTVLGGWKGTGKQANIFSTFVLGAYDDRTKTWYQLVKVHNGFNTVYLKEINKQIHCLLEPSSKNIEWLEGPKRPSYCAIDPSKMPIWDITGDDFTVVIKNPFTINVKSPTVVNAFGNGIGYTYIKDVKNKIKKISNTELIIPKINKDKPNVPNITLLNDNSENHMHVEHDVISEFLTFNK